MNVFLEDPKYSAQIHLCLDEELNNSQDCAKLFANNQFDNPKCSLPNKKQFDHSNVNEYSHLKSDYQTVGTRLRPTLKCIRNTILGIDSSKRYDQLSSSKSDRYRPVEKPEELFQDNLSADNPLTTLPINTNDKSMKLNKTKINSVSTTSLCSDKDSNLDSHPAAMLIPNATTTTTFRSFIKTKSTGIMIRKDHSDEDDEEVEKLCDSECSKISSDLCSTKNNVNNSRHQRGSSVEFAGPKDSTLINRNDNQTDDLCFQSEINCSSTDTTNTDIDITNISNNTNNNKNNINNNNNNNNNNNSNNNNNNSNSKLNSKRHYRTNAILPMLKNNHHFTKHSNLFQTKNFKNIPFKKRSNTDNMSIFSSQDISLLKNDRMVMTQPDEDRRRRTIIIEKQKNSFGFTLQTYGIKHGAEVELITYVDEVAYGGPAFRGGMRPGDVILSINGRDVEKADHPTLVNYINSCEKTMRLVVLFEDCVRKIDLHLNFIKLQNVLHQKLAQLEILNQRENQILLNAALRSRNNNNHNNNNNNNNDDKRNNQLKKYKCKSLDVSLHDLNNDEDSDQLSCYFEGKEYSTTLPRQANNNNAFSRPKTFENDEHEILINQLTDEETNEKQINVNNNQNNNNNNTKHNLTKNQNDENEMNYRRRSKCSLKSSYANSIDCLTNEAYEDDEDLIDVKTKNNSNHNNNNTTTTTNTNKCFILNNNVENDDKDFITKL